jgi:hypothetical protein
MMCYDQMWYANYVAFAASVSNLKTHIHNSATTKRIYTPTHEQAELSFHHAQNERAPGTATCWGSWYCELAGERDIAHGPAMEAAAERKCGRHHHEPLGKLHL